MKHSDTIFVAAGLGLFAFVASPFGGNMLRQQLKTASLAIPLPVSIRFPRFSRLIL
jgi:hypothetical protein